MKLKISVLSVFFFLAIINVQGQPGFNEPFNPFYICHTNAARADYFFYGEIVALQRLENVNVDSKMMIYKAVVRVEKSFKGALPSEIPLYIGYKTGFANPSVENKYLFYAADGKLNAPDGKLSKEKVYFSESLSRPLTDYSAAAIAEVFAGIEAMLGGEKADYVEGAVFEDFSNVREVVMKPEDADRLAKNIRTSQPLADILLEATSEKDGKIYQARTDREGKFRIDNIAPGEYKIKLYLPADKEYAGLAAYSTDGTPCARKWYLPVRSKEKQ